MLAAAAVGKYWKQSLYVLHVSSLLSRVMKLRSQNGDKNRSNPAAWFNEPGKFYVLV